MNFTSNQLRDFHQIFVAFSENLNCIISYSASWILFDFFSFLRTKYNPFQHWDLDPNYWLIHLRQNQKLFAYASLLYSDVVWNCWKKINFQIWFILKLNWPFFFQMGRLVYFEIEWSMNKKLTVKENKFSYWFILKFDWAFLPNGSIGLLWTWMKHE